MVDTLTPRRRSENMRRIRSKGMKPEMLVRRLVHGMGYRYRLHVPNLPGKPDLVFPSRRKVIFVHGCFCICTMIQNAQTGGNLSQTASIGGRSWR